eukprot:6922720-Heterocapsa_arctica.AAC.1
MEPDRKVSITEIGVGQSWCSHLALIYSLMWRGTECKRARWELRWMPSRGQLVRVIEPLRRSKA